MPTGLPPVADSRARILILGTLPSVQSLQHQHYYGNPQNAFWRLVFALLGERLPADYADRVAALRARGIALWDVLASGQRTGSADATIRQPTANDFTALAGRCPALTHLFFNSHNAARWYARLVRPDPLAHLPRTTLPSSSPARAMPFAQKLALWRPLGDALTDAGAAQRTP